MNGPWKKEKNTTIWTHNQNVFPLRTKVHTTLLQLWEITV